ncbi:site-specific DNA-methyltransferase [candidate division KSB1 bacterium]|nr:site-specific DNA-methyltransferase [candidate division KSB1 bacterium]
MTDPPYRTISGGNAPTDRNGYPSSVLHRNDGKIFDHNEVKPQEWFPMLFNLLKPGGHAYVMTNNLNLELFLATARETGFLFSNLLIWEKNNVNANRWYMKNTELTLFLQKKPATQINNCGSKQIFKADNPRNKSHPTEKPVALMRHYIENSTAPGQVVFDPFAGTGSTLVAAQQSCRTWIGCEIDFNYYFNACERLGK